MSFKSFRDLVVWQKAYDLSIRVMKLTKTFPPDERFRLVDQMIRSSSSIPMNIAEGFGRWSPKDQANFYALAKTSGDELKVQLLRSADLGYCSSTKDELALTDEACAMLYVLRRRVLSRG